MKNKNNKFWSTDWLLPLLQQLQQVYAGKCYAFWIHADKEGTSFQLHVGIKRDRYEPLVDFNFYTFDEPDVSKNKYFQLCDYLKQVN